MDTNFFFSRDSEAVLGTQNGLSNKAPANSCQSISTARTEALLLLFLLLLLLLLLILLLLLLLLLAILQPRR